MRWQTILLLVLIALGCKKPEKYSVSYKYIQISGSLVETSAEFTVRTQTTKKEGPIKTQFWESEEIPEMEEGQKLFFTLIAKTGSGTFVMQILREGGILEQDTVKLSHNQHTLEGTL